MNIVDKILFTAEHQFEICHVVITDPSARPKERDYLRFSGPDPVSLRRAYTISMAKWYVLCYRVDHHAMVFPLDEVGFGTEGLCMLHQACLAECLVRHRTGYPFCIRTPLHDAKQGLEFLHLGQEGLIQAVHAEFDFLIQIGLEAGLITPEEVVLLQKKLKGDEE